MVLETAAVEMAPGRWRHPPSFYCPISRQCMHDPVVLADGHSYERHYIERWLQAHRTSPVTGGALAKPHLFANHALRNAIEEYFQQVFSVHRHAIRQSLAGPVEGTAQGGDSQLLRTIDALMQCSLLLNADLSAERVLKHIMQEAKTLVGAEVASAFLVDQERGELFSTVNSTGAELRIPLAVGIAGHVAASGESVIIFDAYADGRFDRSVDRRTGFVTKNMMCVPLSVRSAGTIGVVQLINKTAAGALHGGDEAAAEAFTVEDLQFLQVFASQAANAIVHRGGFPMEPRVEEPRHSEKSGVPAQPPAPQKTKAPQDLEQGLLLAPEAEEACRAAVASQPSSGSASTLAGASRCGSCLSDCDDVDEEEAEQPMLQRVSSRRSRRLPCLPKDELTNHLARATCQLAVVAEAAESWDFDALAFAEMTSSRPLSRLFQHLCGTSDLLGDLAIDQQRASRWIHEVEAGYSSANAYHNAAHAAAVLHAGHALLELGGVGPLAAAAAEAPPLELLRLAVWIAAAMHDYDHLGLSNGFLEKTRHERAVLYNDKSVNEQHHVAQGWTLLKRKENDFLSDAVSSSDLLRLRRLTIDMVLATDMAEHGRVLQALRDTVASRADASAPFAPSSQQEVSQLLQVTMKAADLGHACMEWRVHVRWVDLLETELFAQGDQERALGMPISFLMDRSKPGASETQVGFYDHMVFPLLDTLAAAAPGSAHLRQGALANQARWRGRGASGQDDAEGERD